ncbi:hypothetical protein OH773_01340 [Buttiauxella sp. WJP83]|uniref:hypothetical protein n=1 Tax=Buttiauxella sp. WJP83 TaxID=2986951 RepID=UPI0022DD530C|nr:hypothetical protein [Buttiauxella sp. WJP83]WBM70941.1 hypothetical protein OH773_01340 [Buttiauxella sp. WJP83]
MTLTNNISTTNTISGSTQKVTGKYRYTQSIDNTGWLWVKIEPDTVNSVKKLLCDFTKVLLLKEEAGRTFFTILEGVYAKKNASMSTKNAKKCLVSIKRSSGAIITVTKSGRQLLVSVPRNNDRHNQLVSTLKFNGDSATITLDSEVDYIESNRNSPNNGKLMHSSPLPKGRYRILSPSYPKNSKMTSFYRTNPGGFPNLKYDTVWFPIEYPGNYNSSFVHVGHLSEGCVTIYQLNKWNAIYEYLISNRSDKEGKYVGTLIIN